MINRFIREPLFLFSVVGIAVFAWYFYLESKTTEVIQLDPYTKAEFIDQFELLTGRKATEDDIKRIEKNFIEEEILFREAIASGMHLTDPKIRIDLLTKMRYQITGIMPEPTESQLVQYYLDNIKQYFIEPGVSFRHIYFKQQPDSAEAMLQKLLEGETIQGDEFWHGYDMQQYGESMIRSIFGPVFLQNLKQAPLNQWIGLVQSTTGWHYVVVSDRQPETPLSFDDALPQITQDYINAGIQNAVSSKVKELESQYQVIRSEN